MPHPEPHATGQWRRAQITTTRVASTFAPDAATIALVEAAWAAAQAKPGVHLFDGPTCRLERLEATPDHLHLAWSPSSYKWFLGTNGTHPHVAQRGDAIGTSAAVVSSDGWLVFGRRSTAVPLYPGYAHPFGGILEPAANVDVIAEMERELQEELDLGPSELADLVCLGLGVDPRLRQPELLYLAQTTRSRTELERRMDPAEHSGCWCVRATADDLDTVLRDPAGDLTPVTRLVLERYRATI
jgi:hypothetical protein